MRAGQVLAALLCVVGIAACSSSEVEVAVAEVGGTTYTYSDFEAFLALNGSLEPGSLSEVALSALFEEFVDELCLERLTRDATEAGGALPELESVPEPVLEEEMRALFQARPAEYLLPERLVLGQILASDRAAAEKVRGRILEGLSLEEAAADVEGAVFSGYQEGVMRSDLPPVLSEAIFSLAQGELSSIVEADYGFHVFHVLKRLPEESLSFAEARSDLEEELEARRAREWKRAMVAEARVRYNVVLQPRNLPFELVAPSQP